MIACAAGCVRRGEHKPGCATDDCVGCLPREAATGYMCCSRCVDRALEALHALPGLFVDVEDAGVLKAPQKGAGGSGRPIPLDADGAEWRTRLRACLVGWCLVLEEDFSASLSGAQDTVAWMIDRVGVYAGRILASEHADQLVADLCGWVEEDGTRHEGLAAEGRRLAFRSRGAAVTVQCPCGKRVVADTDEVMRCRGCGEEGVLSWWRTMLVGEDPQPMRLSDLPDWLLVHHGREVTMRALRDWADKGLICPIEVGVLPQGGGRGVRRFDPVAVAAVVLSKRLVRTA